MIRLSIRRPVGVAMLYGAVAALGAFAWRNIPIELLPDTRLPRLTVNASWRGASPETVEAFLTSPLESAIQQVRGVEKITSTSHERNGAGVAAVEVEFARDTDMDFARLELSERVSSVEDDLPDAVSAVSVQPYVPEEFQDQNRPFLRYTFTGPYTLEALRRHLDEVVAPALAEVRGVAVVRVSGGRERRLDVRLDPEAIRSLGLEPAAAQRAISSLDLVREAGSVRRGDAEWTVTIVNRPASAADVRNAVLLTRGGVPVTVADVARVTDTFEEATALTRIDGDPSVTVDLVREIGSNTVAVADAVKERVAGVERLSPYGARFILVDDESEEIRNQLSDLRTRALASAAVVFVVLLAFLGSVRSAALVFATIAFSVLIALNLVYFAGLSLNLLTLMGLAMGFGLIVDNAIVVLENVWRRRQGGEEAAAAAEGGTREVVLPILASTATTLIVFVPFVYLQGELRIFYVPLAVVVALTLVASLLVAFTFIPALSARMPAGAGARPGSGSGPGGGDDRAFGDAPEAADAQAGASDTDAPLTAYALPAAAGAPSAAGFALRHPPLYLRFYEGLVGFTLRHPWIAVGVTVACLAGSGWLFDRYVTRGAVWGGSWGSRTYVSIQIELPRGSSLDRTDQLVAFFEDKLVDLPEVDRVTAFVNETRGYMEVTFPDSLETTWVPVAIKEQMVAYSHTFTGAEVRVYGYGPSFYGGGMSPPNYAIQVLGYNYETVRDIAESLGRRLSRLSRIDEVDTNASGRFTRDRAVEYVVRVDRDALARHDLTVGELVSGLNAAVGGSASLGRVKLGGEEVQVRVKLAGTDSLDVRALTETLLPLPDGRRIRAGDLVSVAPRRVLAAIRRENQQYERRVAYEFRGPRKLGDLVRDRVMESTVLPAGYALEVAEGWRWRDDEREQVHLVLAVSLMLVFMVTAALFESLRQPFCVLLTVPMAAIGVFLLFFYTGATFTREAYIGAIMTGGIVVNNAILLVDHVNRVRRLPGLGLEAAVLRGTLERVRPILMTTATTVLGLLPLVLASGADENIWNALGFTLIGGLLSSTLFVLTTTPALYLLLERRTAGDAAARAGPAGGAAAPLRGAGAPA